MSSRLRNRPSDAATDAESTLDELFHASRTRRGSGRRSPPATPSASGMDLTGGGGRMRRYREVEPDSSTGGELFGGGGRMRRQRSVAADPDTAGGLFGGAGRMSRHRGVPEVDADLDGVFARPKRIYSGNGRMK